MECRNQAKRQESSEVSNQNERQNRPVVMDEKEVDQRKTVYKITNTKNGKVYVGCCSDLSKRKYAHKMHVIRGDYKNGSKLYPDMNAFGFEVFEFGVLELCSRERASEREAYWIGKLNSCANGYNTTTHGLCGPGPWIGRKRPDISARRLADKKSILRAIDATRKAVVCVETGKSYASITKAAEMMGMTVSAVARAVKENRMCGGLTFKLEVVCG